VKKEHVKIVAAFVLMLLAIGVFVRFGGMGRPPGGQTQEYYLNLKSGNLFAVDAQRHPPIDAPGGGTGVRALVITCGKGCSESERKIAYVERYADAVLPLIDKKPESFDEEEAINLKLQQGMLVALVPDGDAEPQWFPGMSGMGEKILNRPRELCGGEYRPCKP